MLFCVPRFLVASCVCFCCVCFSLFASSVSAQKTPELIPAPSPEFSSGWTSKKMVIASKDMVVAAHPLAVDAGVEILRAGGSATDAAIAIQMVLTLVEPQSSGIGGGAFMLHFDAGTKKIESYDGRETAPAAAKSDLFSNADGTPVSFATRVGGRAVGTPGVLRMLELAHKEKGKLPWAKLFEPAIRLCETGFALTPRFFSAITGDANQSWEPKLKDQPLAAPAYFYNADGSPKPVGTIIRNPALAVTFRAIAAGGANAFYSGEIARDMVAAVRNHPTNPGLLTEADLAKYQAKKREPLCASYRREWKVCTMAAPSSAAAMLMTLGILENFDVAALGAQTVESTHLISEAYRLAYADRALYMADADFYPVPMAGLLDKAYLKSRAALIRMDRSMGTPIAGTPPGTSKSNAADTSAELPGTSHISIVDKDGNALSMTTTIEAAFGAKQMVRGFLLNNQLTDFSFVGSVGNKPVANRVEAGKRPRSAMAPAIIFDKAGHVHMVVGSPDGGNIIQHVTKTIVGVLDWKLNIQDAINLGNFGAQTSAVTRLERGTPSANLKAGLEAKGHTVSLADSNSGIHGITRVPMGWAGGADPRREGIPRGWDASQGEGAPK
jgi:gamma-glutamyltranspeptidase / glutathione hydrolase